MQSDLTSKLHIGIIMDGNGRWAAARGLPRSAGHEAGVEAIRRVAEAAPEQGVGTLTLYAFSCDNWRRPQAEVSTLMGLLRAYLRTEAARLARSGVRLTVIGRRDRLPRALRCAIEGAERATEDGTRLRLRIALDYSARDCLARAAALAGGREPSREELSALLGRAMGEREPAPDVDLLVRTGGEQRLSDFLLWECAYAELFFSPRAWPEFGPEGLRQAVEWFHGRERRFGRVPRAAAG